MGRSWECLGSEMSKAAHSVLGGVTGEIGQRD